MTLWEKLEEWLFEYVTFGGTFTHAELVGGMHVSRERASAMIQSYQKAQRAKDSRTLYVLYRGRGRTAAAEWEVGVRTRNARRLGKTFGADVKVKWMRAVQPDLERIATVNPRAAATSRQSMEKGIDGAIQVLEAALNGIGEA